MQRRGSFSGEGLGVCRPRRSGRGTDARGRVQHFRAGQQGHGHGGRLHRPGGRSVAAVPQRRRPGVRRASAASRSAPPGSAAPRRSFEGANPFPGEGYSAEQKKLSEFPPHLYYVQPINDTWKFGLGIETAVRPHHRVEEPRRVRRPLRLAPRRRSQAIDLNPTIGWQITPTFGLGIGAIAALLGRRAQPRHPADQPVHPAGRRRGAPKARGRLRRGLRLQRRHPAQVQRQLLLGPLLPQQDQGRLRRRRPAHPGPRPATPSSTPSSVRGSPFDRNLPVETTRSNSRTRRASAWPSA